MALESQVIAQLSSVKLDAVNCYGKQVSKRPFGDHLGGLRSSRSHIPFSFEAPIRRTERRGRIVMSAESGSSLGTSPPKLRRKVPVKEVLLVDPVVAKRMAEEDMQRRLQMAAKQRQRRTEAINGGWAMIGLAAGVIVEGRTGQGIIAQVASYLDTVATFFEQLSSSL